MKGLSMKGLNFSKRSIARYVDEDGRRLKGFYPALRAHARAVVTRNRIDFAAFEVEPVAREKSTRIPTNWGERYTGTIANASNSGFSIVRPSRPAPALPSKEARAAQSIRDREACIRSKRRKGLVVVLRERRAA